jgi:hypothetical protein
MSRDSIFLYLQERILLRLQETNGEVLIVASLPDIGIVELCGVDIEPAEVTA